MTDSGDTSSPSYVPGVEALSVGVAGVGASEAVEGLLDSLLFIEALMKVTRAASPGSNFSSCRSKRTDINGGRQSV